MNKPVSFDVDSAHEIAPAFAARFTTTEFLRMIELGAFGDMKIELVEGQLERMPPPKSKHAGRQLDVLFMLAAVVSRDKLFGEVGIDLGKDTLLGCDAAIVRQPVEGNRMLDPAEIALVIEVAETTAARDRGMKRLAYAQAVIPFYWVVDGQLGVTHIYSEPTNGDYAQIATIRFGEPLPVPGTDATIVID